MYSYIVSHHELLVVTTLCSHQLERESIDCTQLHVINGYAIAKCEYMAIAGQSGEISNPDAHIVLHALQIL